MRHTARALKTPLRGAFAPLRVLDGLGSQARVRLLAAIRDAGLTVLLTEGHALPGWVIDDTRNAGLGLGGGVSCFSDHAGSFRDVSERLRPVTASGETRPMMEWYRGIIPTDSSYEDDLVAACITAAAEPGLALFTLDFVRWPIHWELELRAGATPLDSSFDRLTLSRFCEEMGVDLPVGDPRAASAAIRASLASEWATFKCNVITGVVRRIVEAIRGVRPDLPIGVFVVPGDEEQRRRYAGQDVAALGSVVDLLLPMAYHAMLRRPPEWVGEVVADIRGRTTTPLVPVIQATAERAVAGSSDWGSPFGADEFGQAVDAALRATGDGLIVFPAHGLDAPRLTALRRRLLSG